MRNLNESGIKPLKNEIEDFFEELGERFGEVPIEYLLEKFFDYFEIVKDICEKIFITIFFPVVMFELNRTCLNVRQILRPFEIRIRNITRRHVLMFHAASRWNHTRGLCFKTYWRARKLEREHL